MSQSTTDKAHHSWVAPSSQISQSIIENMTGSSPAAKANEGEQPFTSIPPLPRRSSHNYEQDSARFFSPSAGQTAGNTASRSDDSGKPLRHERQKSFSREDQKRLAHAFMMTEGDEKSFTEKE